MPIYLYLCKCGNQFEKFVRKMDDAPAPCDKCGQFAPKIDASPAPFVWGKGGGW